MSMTQYISNTNHYKEVLSRVQSVKHSLWIGTADIKDLYVETGKEILSHYDGVEAYWITADYETYSTDGFEKLLVK